ncbi:MAG: tryptophan 7-halogenase, partial [Massilia sp.]|nr:tryptophan 7-halogenase [Massilia sp.]
FTTDEEAGRVLLAGLDGEAQDAPRQLRFTTGRRRKSWVKNCVAIGLSGGFLEPLESTSINFIEFAVGKLIEYFPDRECRQELANEFNRLLAQSYEYVRDFIVLHYKLTDRSDSEFWRYCANMPIPDTLQHQIETFRETGRLVVYDLQGFREPSMFSLLMGLGVVPKRVDPLIENLQFDQLLAHLASRRDAIMHMVKAAPEHALYISRHCAAP